MIKHIVLRGVSSYCPDTNLSIGPLTKVNLFYGHNGTGKTTIGNFLQSPHENDYQHCRVQPVNGDRELVVYNHNFLEQNFQASSQPGVFTLNEGNIEAEKALMAAEAELQSLAKERQKHLDAGMELAGQQTQADEKLWDDLWAQRKLHDSSALKYCFLLLNTREKLAQKVTALQLVPVTDTFEALAAEARELLEADGEELPAIPAFSFPQGEIELDSLLQETIIGSDNSYLGALINELGSSDWIRQALGFANQEDPRCPFCQQALPEGFYTELGRVFDQTYAKRVKQLISLKARYDAGAAHIQDQSRRKEYQLPDFQAHFAALEVTLQKNVQLLASKVSSPSIPISLTSTADLLNNLNSVVKVEQEKIDAFNLKVRNRKAYLEKIKASFWDCFRVACDGIIVSAEKACAQNLAKREEKRQAIEEIKGKAQIQKNIITKSRAQITNIDQAVENINASLTMLGLKGFEVVREQGELPRYRLERPNRKEGVFKTLSEGEKTLISFLYFLEVCNGELDSKSGKLKSNRVIVIDDPISSLSHNYVYDIASLIYRRVLNPKERFKQVFILTHNLFFFHEMLKNLKRGDDFSLFRITKAEYTAVIPMKASDVQNDYQSFWQTIRDAQEGRTSASVIPNMMRNILEYYFNFVHRQEALAEALQALADEDTAFRALYRYVNRESHSDAINLTDFGEIEPAHYIERFRQVFVRTGFEEHYLKMMG